MCFLQVIFIYGIDLLGVIYDFEILVTPNCKTVLTLKAPDTELFFHW